jgi:small GTP-binding protein
VLQDTAGQERFLSLHPSYYHQADACIMVFDATRKVTYKNLIHWYTELRQYRPEIPCFLAANKIDCTETKLWFYKLAGSSGVNKTNCMNYFMINSKHGYHQAFFFIRGQAGHSHALCIGCYWIKRR